MANDTTIDAHSTSDAGTRVPVKPGPRNEQYVTQLDPERDLVLNETQRQVDALKKDLPAAQFPGEINWLGSSYTGQDIKVIAHLYDAAKDSVSPKEESIGQDIDYFTSLKAGASNLRPSLNQLALDSATWDELASKFDDATGLDSSDVPQQRAIKELRNQVLIGGDFSSFIGLAKAQARLDQIVEFSTLSQESLQNELKRVKDLHSKGTSTLDLGALQTISIQSHREKFGVRALGHSYVKGYTRGPRTLAGSMIFTVFDEHPLRKLIDAMGHDPTWNDPEISSLLPDQLPPIDLTLTFANEYGSTSRLNIYGAEFINDGVTFSIDNLLSEQVINFVARDVDVMTKAGLFKLSMLQRNGGIADDSASGLLGSDDYLKYLDVLRVRRRLVNR